MVRYTAFDGSEFTASNPVGTGVLAAGATNRAHAVTGGVKWSPNQFVKLMVNYVRTDFSTPVTVNAVTTPDERAWTFRAQMDF
jgi:phosphate-selective porin